jgi:biotin carboxylase
MNKRILFLGGSYFQIPPLIYARKQGHYVITCDFLPENPGHKYAHEYHDLSTTDMHAVLQLAEKLHIDAIVAYASDPAAPTAAYVAEKLGLPGNPYESVLTLTRKDLYRKFLEKNGFLTPQHRAFCTYHDAAMGLQNFKLPVVIKPVDSSGSKGVTVLQNTDELKAAFNWALSYSRANAVIIEEFVEKEGYQIAGDGFVVDGQLVFRCFANEHFDYACNGLVPIGESFPYVGNTALQNQIHEEIQRLLTLLEMEVGALNFDIRIDREGGIYLMEIGPRNGGNLIPEVTKYLTGVDMVKYTVDAALGLDCSNLAMQPTNGNYASYILHAQQDGVLASFDYTEEIKACIIEEVRWRKPGDKVEGFRGSNCTLGTQILKFDSQEQMLDCMKNMNEWQKVVLQDHAIRLTSESLAGTQQSSNNIPLYF